ncbi:beta-ketoacyl-[acyl-carrier-protein] synthase family protein [Allosalinactinospora lopnorensis]|uniref:beta-ketoacyl-[acyl-carrier-protein] synthase family protein n=1 Tax=Allosalinactinospora lopnorensis TaxID=1352348 RepID=UPI0006965E61|nr:beta-ketoacyl-[acyl-carrier-protein] synthase family protein [Allosalinactinospora lopnorensis]
MATGASQVGRLPTVITENMQCRAGARLRDFDHRDYVPDLPDRFAKRYSREILIALSAVEQARADAELRVGDETEAQRVGVIGTSSRGPVEWWSQTCSRKVIDSRFPPVEPEQGVFASLPGSPVTLSAIRLGAKGVVTTLSNACVGGHQAVGLALELLRSGQADVMVVIGYETPFVPEVLRVYSPAGAGVLSCAEGDPRGALKPYDRHRDGFVMGEGAVAMVLETEESARRRGIPAYARVGSVITLNEAEHATRMDLSGRFTADMMTQAMAGAGSSMERLDYVCGHGTATRYNDAAESRALRIAVGGRPLPPLGSIKPVFGHLLGASGALNCAATAMMLDKQCLVPTINCVDVDPECDLDHVREGARSTRVRSAMSLSFAIGSQSSALVLEAV